MNNQQQNELNFYGYHRISQRSLPQESSLPNSPLDTAQILNLSRSMNQRRRVGVNILNELMPVGEVMPHHLVLTGGGDPGGRLPHERLPVYASPLRMLHHLLQRRQDRRWSIPTDI
jgi:hypothetical protein